MDRFFQRFPNTTYSNTTILDITRRVKIDTDYTVPNLFYPQTVPAGVRIDQLADAVYGDSELDWSIYISNQIVDPYYQVPLDDAQFQAYIFDKYGDYDYPKTIIKYWRNNWYADDTQISPSAYENNISPELKKYYAPNFGQGTKIISYMRKQADWTQSTNKIHQYTISGGNGFIIGEVVQFDYGGLVGTAEVMAANDSALIVQHLQGNVVANSTWTKTLVGVNSGISVATSSYTVLEETIANNEAVYWSPVYYYDWEVEKNEANKHIYVLNPTVVSSVSQTIRTKLNQ